jgi:hypothetical protein
VNTRKRGQYATPGTVTKKNNSPVIFHHEKMNIDVIPA